MHFASNRLRSFDRQQSFCCPCEGTPRLGEAPEAAGAVTTISASRGASTGRSVMLGVVTGVTVWFVTRMIDRTFGRKL